MDNSDSDFDIVELYRHFLECLHTGNPVEFDFDELIEVYDYASDNNDGYARLHALIKGIAQYPDEPEFRERFAYYLYQQADFIGARKAIDDLPDDSFIRRLLLIAYEQGEEKQKAMLEGLIDDFGGDKLDDEQVIRLVEVCGNIQLFSWVLEAYPRLKAIALYPDTLMNEVSKMAEELDMQSEATHVLEEFASEYPFSDEAWKSLARIYYQRGDYAQADNALNYALAIDPKSYEARALQIEMKFRAGATLVELIPLLDAMIADHPNVKDIVRQKALVLFYFGHNAESARLIRDLIASEDGIVDPEVLNVLLLATKGKGVDDVLASAARRDMSGDTIFLWEDLFREDFANGYFGAAAAIAFAVTRYGNIDLVNDSLAALFMAACYFEGRFDAVANLYSLFLNRGSRLMKLIMAITYLRTAANESELQQLLLTEPESASGKVSACVDNGLDDNALSYYFGRLRSMAAGSQPLDFSVFDDFFNALISGCDSGGYKNGLV